MQLSCGLGHTLMLHYLQLTPLPKLWTGASAVGSIAYMANKEERDMIKRLVG